MERRKLLEELEVSRREIKTDGYSMSIGEMMSLFKEGDLILDPAFQRLFRWGDNQKSSFVESILLGIPIPEIFVAQDNVGKWSVVDGVQRLSTIFQFLGVLENYPPLVLKGTNYLPSLDGVTWENVHGDVKRLFKRAKLNINIILTENSLKGQYDLFQRLNTGGLHLEDQEIRNCLLIMLSQEFYDQVNSLKDYAKYKDSIKISSTKIKEEFHMELIIRFLISKRNKVDYTNYMISKTRLGEFLDSEIDQLINDDEFDVNEAIKLFKKVFDYLFDLLGDKVFRKYDPEKDDFVGAFKQSNFDAILVGVSDNFEYITGKTSEEVIDLIKLISVEEKYIKYSDSGMKALSRFEHLNQFSREYFTND